MSQEILATKENLSLEISNLKTDIVRAINLVATIQYIGIVGSLLAILKFMK